MSTFKELVEEAKKIDILSICQENGIAFKDLGNYAQGIDHDSLMIDKRKNRFTWYSQDINGDSIDFVQTFLNKDSFKEAVHFLTNKDFKKVNVEQREAQKAFSYYFKNSSSYDKAYQYLVNERGIDKDIVEALYEKGLIRQDERGNCIFVWGSNGRIVGATVQGTEVDYEKFGKRGMAKWIAKNSKQHFGFNVTLGTPKKLYIFESPVDALSYWSLNKHLSNCILADMEGLKSKTVVQFINYMYLSKGTLPTEGVFFGVDNDSKGHIFTDKMSQFQFIDNKGRERAFQKMIPQDLQIPKKNISIYQAACSGVYSGVDWRAIAAIHKAITNLSDTDELSNAWKYDKYFGKVRRASENPEKVDLIEECGKVAHDLYSAQLPNGEYDFEKVLKEQDNSVSSLQGITRKVMSYFDDYQNLGYRPADEIIKDWNDELKLKKSQYREIPIPKRTTQSTVKRKENYVGLSR